MTDYIYVQLHIDICTASESIKFCGESSVFMEAPSYLLYYHVLQHPSQPGKQHNPPSIQTDYSSLYKHTPPPPPEGRGLLSGGRRREGGRRDLDGFIFTL